ncbi:MAG: hypothetical protein M1831_000995 [Alyxoria varia]|nr:MAG: hypothetical protein M1831_000995 [Alyxoria varia]
MPQYVAGLLDESGPGVHTAKGPIASQDLTVTRDPENVQAIFSTQAQDFDIGPNRAPAFKPLLGDGLTTAQGAIWRRSRALLRPQFSKESISNLDLEERHVGDMLRVLESRIGADGWTGHVDLHPMFLNLTFDAAIEMLYGAPVNVQKRSLDKQQNAQFAPPETSNTLDDDALEFGNNVEAGKTWLYERMLFGKFNWLVRSKRFSEICENVHAYVDRLVHARLQAGPNEKSNADNGEKFVLLNELAKQTQNPTELRNETLHVLSAGKDTTAALMGWLFYFLARNRRVFNELRQTILREFSQGITFRGLHSCRYLQNCINEAFRVAAIIPVIERVTNVDTTLPRGGGPFGDSPMFFRKGSRILISTFGMQHRADIWGPDVEDFKPERWDDHRAGYEFVPFAGGPRKCIGQQFALTEASYTIVRLLQRFDDIENVEPPGPIRFHHALTNSSGTGIQVRLHAAK